MRMLSRPRIGRKFIRAQCPCSRTSPHSTSNINARSLCGNRLRHTHSHSHSASSRNIRNALTPTATRSTARNRNSVSR
jgi:hypothetical protein